MHSMLPFAFPDRRISARGWRRAAGSLAVLCGAAFVALATILVVHLHRQPSDIDGEEIEILRVTGHGFMFRFGQVVSTVSSPGAVAVAGLGIGAFLLWRRRTLEAILVVAAPAIAGIAETGVKQLVHRPRPLTASLTGEGGYGFPSGHVAGFTALAVIVVCVVAVAARWRLIWAGVAAIAIAAVALARLAVGAHYLT